MAQPGFTVPWNEPTRPALPEHLYVHVPLCRSKCAYCSFYSVADDGSVVYRELVADVIQTLDAWHTPEVRPVPLQTLYIGGGTPTVMGEDLAVLVRGIVGLSPLAPGAEVTI